MIILIAEFYEFYLQSFLSAIYNHVIDIKMMKYLGPHEYRDVISQNYAHDFSTTVQEKGDCNFF